MKLIKINEEHYIVVDDSEIKKGDYFYSIRNLIEKAIINYPSGEHIGKITHSTKPLAPIKELMEKGYDNILPLDIDEIKELIGEVDVEKKAHERYFEQAQRINDSNIRGYIVSATKGGFIDGYNQSLEDNKEKKYTEEDIRKAILMARVRIENVSPKYSIDEIFQSLQPKTE